mmetsp:Transcript_48295/g.116129  ORF Transcript_48295/g.116129 Transcript_48295/m.116129 type:complete len:439 (+) Transcript_48295:308-1624(+)
MIVRSCASSRMMAEYRTLAQELAQQHAVGHVLEHGAIRRAVLEADRVAHLVAQLGAHLLGDARRHRHGGDAPRLRAADLLVVSGVARLVQVLRDLRRLARARLAHDDEHLVLVDRLDDLLAVGEDWQALAHLRQRLLHRRRRHLGLLGLQVARDDLVRDELDLLVRRHHQPVVLLPHAADLGLALAVLRAHTRRRALDLVGVPRLVLGELLALLLLVFRHERLEALVLVGVALVVVGRGHRVPVHLVGDVDPLVGEVVQLLLVLILGDLALRQLALVPQELLVGQVVARRLEHLLLALRQVLVPRRPPQLVEELGLLVGSVRSEQPLTVAQPRLLRRRLGAAQRLRVRQVAHPQALRELVSLAEVLLARLLRVERRLGLLALPLLLLVVSPLALALVLLGAPPLLLLGRQRLLHRRRHLVRLVRLVRLDRAVGVVMLV